MRYISAAGMWAVTIWMDVTVMRLPGDKGRDELIGLLLTLVSLFITLCILFHGQSKTGR